MKPSILTVTAGGHVFAGTLQEFNAATDATCAACGEDTKQDGVPWDAWDRDGAGVNHRMYCDGWKADAPRGVLVALVRGMTREAYDPDDVALPARQVHEAAVSLYSEHWDASSEAHEACGVGLDPRPRLHRIGQAREALETAIMDEEHALRMALAHEERP